MPTSPADEQSKLRK